MNLLVVGVLFLAGLALLLVIVVALQEEEKQEFNFDHLAEELNDRSVGAEIAETAPEQPAKKEDKSDGEVPVEDSEQKEIFVEESEAESESTTESEPGEEVTEPDPELSFEPINTFAPEVEQWSGLYQELNRYPWPESDESRTLDYDDRTSLSPASENLRAAVDWILEASTEAIHQHHKYQEFIENLLPFIESPRAAGAEVVAGTQWRDKAANISRLLGERLLTIAFGLSCYGPVEMDSHREALEVLLAKQWNADGLESPLLYQVIGRLGLLTPTETEDLQQVLISRISGCAPRRRGTEQKEEIDKKEKARFHSLLLAVSMGPNYPFPRAENDLSRLWHWEESSPPLAGWDHLQPVLFTLWNYHWINEDQSEAVRDLAALFGSWWDDSSPETEFFHENPDTWEALLMCCWAWAPGHQMVWNKLQDRYEELELEDPRLREITAGYVDWHEHYLENSEAPPEAFSGRRFPPREWIAPLASDILDEASQPSFNFPQSWLEALGELESPDLDVLRREVS